MDKQLDEFNTEIVRQNIALREALSRLASRTFDDPLYRELRREATALAAGRFSNDLPTPTVGSDLLRAADFVRDLASYHNLLEAALRAERTFANETERIFWCLVTLLEEVDEHLTPEARIELGRCVDTMERQSKRSGKLTTQAHDMRDLARAHKRVA